MHDGEKADKQIQSLTAQFVNCEPWFRFALHPYFVSFLFTINDGQKTHLLTHSLTHHHLIISHHLLSLCGKLVGNWNQGYREILTTFFFTITAFNSIQLNWYWRHSYWLMMTTSVECQAGLLSPPRPTDQCVTCCCLHRVLQTIALHVAVSTASYRPVRYMSTAGQLGPAPDRVTGLRVH